MSKPAQSDWLVCIDFGTAMSKAAAAPVDAASPQLVRPLAIGRPVGAVNPLMAPGAVFIGERVHFGPAALSQASAHLEQRREPMLSFKTVLSAEDPEAALKLRAPRAVDPTGKFDRRGIVVLFLAWLFALIDHAVAADPAIEADPKKLRVRYSRPGWNPRQLARAHRTVSRMFDEARFIAAHAGPTLLDLQGVPTEEALALLSKAHGESLDSVVEGCLLEAVAAAVCRSPAMPKSAVWLVLDIGAGTTDIAALQLTAGGQIQELEGARKTWSQAGDVLDRILLDLFVSKARNAKSVEQQSALWRRTLLTVREQKEGLFASGRAALRYDGKVVTVKRSDLEGDRDFKEFRRNLESTYAQSLEIAAAAAQSAGLSDVAVVLAGGGANLGFVQEIAAKTKPKKSKTRIHVEPLVPQWADASDYQGQLGPVFSQLSIAMGGGLAPPHLVSVEMDESQAA